MDILNLTTLSFLKINIKNYYCLLLFLDKEMKFVELVKKMMNLDGIY